VALENTAKKAKYLILKFPSNPTAQVVDLDFFKKIIALAKANDLIVIHDFVYADFILTALRRRAYCRSRGPKI
jgi:alanine-synthesizing transaminase